MPDGAGARSGGVSPAQERRRGVWLGVDVGTVRVGVARSDPRGVLAVPVETLRRDRRADTDLDRIVELADQHKAVGVVVGLPLTLRGQHAASAELATRYGERIAQLLPGLAVVYVDERLSTVSAARTLSGHGVRGRAGRAVIDQAAAVEILQRWLDTPHPRPDRPPRADAPGADSSAADSSGAASLKAEDA